MTVTVILRRTAGLCCAAAAAIHFGVTGEHFHQWWLYGVFFLFLAAYQLWWAAISWQSPSRRELGAGAVVNAAVIALWLMTRTTGLPFGPDAGTAESFGTADIVCAALEAVVVGLVVALTLAAARPLSRLDRSTNPRIGGAVVAAVAALALGSSGVALAAPGESGMHDAAGSEDPAGIAGTDGMAGMDGMDGMTGMAGTTGTSGTNGERHNMSNLPDVGAATPAQTAAAKTLLTRTEASTAAYRGLSAAQKAGFRLDPALRRWHANHPTASAATPIKELHVANPAYRADGKVADPSAPETLIYSQRRTPTGGPTWTLIGVMYVAPNGQPGPDLGGPYTRWHFHDTADDGTPEKKTAYMMHIWFVAPDQLRAAYAMTPPVAEITAYQRSLAN
ncbi:MAG: hypothetical protein M3P23_06140 [Actinomycetota bacterium]|nr:hypothetical protein [Actinomycetota bacterium]